MKQRRFSTLFLFLGAKCKLFFPSLCARVLKLHGTEFSRISNGTVDKGKCESQFSPEIEEWHARHSKATGSGVWFHWKKNLTEHWKHDSNWDLRSGSVVDAERPDSPEWFIRDSVLEGLRYWDPNCAHEDFRKVVSLCPMVWKELRQTNCSVWEQLEIFSHFWTDRSWFACRLPKDLVTKRLKYGRFEGSPKQVWSHSDFPVSAIFGSRDSSHTQRSC